MLRPEAEQDLQAGWHWYEAQRPGLGDEFATEAHIALQQVGAIPEAFAIKWRDVRSHKVKRFPYLIHYRVLPDRVEVLAVVHGRRDPSVWKGRA